MKRLTVIGAAVIAAVLVLNTCNVYGNLDTVDRSGGPRVNGLKVTYDADADSVNETEMTLDPSFTPEIRQYKADITKLPEPGRTPVTVEASHTGNVEVKYIPAQKFTPIHGLNCVVEVTEKDTAYKSSYYITFFDPNGAPLDGAVLDHIEVTANNVTSTYTADNSQTYFDEASKTFTIFEPYGTTQVVVNAVGPTWQRPNYINYNPGVTLELDSSGGEMEISITADGYSPSTYKVIFKINPPLKSELSDVQPQQGLITDYAKNPVNFNKAPNPEETAQYITIPGGMTALTVTAVPKKPADKVWFTQDANVTVGTVGLIGPGSGKTHLEDGRQFSITVNEGAGYEDRTYRFEIRTSAGTIDVDQAYLAAMSFGNNNVSPRLFQRNIDGSNSTASFDKTWFNYNLVYTAGETQVSITAAPEQGCMMTIKHNGVTLQAATSSQTTVNISNPISGMQPVQIIVQGNGKSQGIYMVYFKPQQRLPARLKNVEIVNGILGAAFAKDTLNYEVNVATGTSVVIVDPEPEYAFFTMTFTPDNYLTGNDVADGKQVKVKVSGGEDWIDSEYIFTIKTQAALLPRLKTLTICNQTYTATTTPNVNDCLSFDGTIASDGPATSQIKWTADASIIGKVEYSSDLQSWTEGGINSGSFTINIPSDPDIQTLRYIRVTAKDSSSAVYCIRVLRAKSAEKSLSNLEYKHNGLAAWTQVSTPQAFKNDIFYYMIELPRGLFACDLRPSFDPLLNLTIKWSAGTVEPNISVQNGGTISLTSMTQTTTVRIQVTAEDGTSNVYVVTIVPTDPGTPPLISKLTYEYRTRDNSGGPITKELLEPGMSALIELPIQTMYVTVTPTISSANGAAFAQGTTIMQQLSWTDETNTSVKMVSYTATGVKDDMTPYQQTYAISFGKKSFFMTSGDSVFKLKSNGDFYEVRVMRSTSNSERVMNYIPVMHDANDVKALVVGGGGGGGRTYYWEGFWSSQLYGGGGGGAGGYINQNIAMMPAGSYKLTIGGGGAGGVEGNGNSAWHGKGQNGGNTSIEYIGGTGSFTTITAKGGGGGGGYRGTKDDDTVVAANPGGSGGGGVGWDQCNPGNAEQVGGGNKGGAGHSNKGSANDHGAGGGGGGVGGAGGGGGTMNGGNGGSGYGSHTGFTDTDLGTGSGLNFTLAKGGNGNKVGSSPGASSTGNGGDAGAFDENAGGNRGDNGKSGGSGIIALRFTHKWE